MPLDWLFERAECLIHPGGIGTIGRALCNGCPMLVEPQSHDQFFNALLALKGEFGVAINPVRMGPRSLARLLEEKVLTEDAKTERGRDRLDRLGRIPRLRMVLYAGTTPGFSPGILNHNDSRGHSTRLVAGPLQARRQF